MGTRITLAADPRNVARARDFCASTLDGWGADADLIATCVLLVSELATNAVIHARTTFTVDLERDGALRVQVLDDDPCGPYPREYRLDSISGRGMHLVEALARTMGVSARAPGKAVWFELDWEPEMAR